uniref:Uncharacterized protein n=1 Tax=Arundo donax TaxID=35708 RepID=A0A0A9EJU6_ARUDO
MMGRGSGSTSSYNTFQWSAGSFSRFDMFNFMDFIFSCSYDLNHLGGGSLGFKAI